MVPDASGFGDRGGLVQRGPTHTATAAVSSSRVDWG